ADIPTEPAQTMEKFTHLQNGSIPPYLSLNFKGPAFNDKQIDMPAIDVLNTILFSQNSDLYKKLVIDERKLRFLGGGAGDSRDPNLIGIQASFIDKKDFQYVKDEIIKAIDEIKKNGVYKKLLT
ncbi:MAG: insulinase family protein, partial [Bacteroidetes bacterium]|nr:insulinase family protein [Bacteroidota bacterium]